MSQNKICSIMPYKFGNSWVFDDPQRGLKREGLVGGVPAIIVAACQKFGIKRPELGVTFLFSDEPFPDANVVLTKVGPDGSGTIYQWDGTEMKGWLCANLRLYFHPPPEKIYVSLQQVQHSYWTQLGGWINGY